MDDEDLSYLDNLPEKDLDEIANENGITDLKKLNEALIRAGDAHFQAWLEDEYPVGKASQRKILAHIDKALLLLDNEDYQYRLEITGVNVIRLQKNLRNAVITIKKANQPVRPGPRQQKALRAFVDTLAAYWTDELGESFNPFWGKNNFYNEIVPENKAARFVFDMAKVIELESAEMLSIRKATAEAVRAFRVRG